MTAPRRIRHILLVSFLTLPAWTASADDPPRPDNPLVKLLRSGKVPEERQGTVVEMIGKRGTAADLSYLFDRAVKGDGFPGPVRRKALAALAEAATTRKLRPEGDLSGLRRLLQDRGDAEVRREAVRLAGLWKVEALGDDLRSIAESPETAPPLREAALGSLAEIGGRAGREAIEALTRGDRPPEVRTLGIAALAAIDREAAAERAAGLLRDAPEGLDLAPVLSAFLNRQGGSDTLAEAIAKQPPPADAARRALRAMFALGRSDGLLLGALTMAAGLNAEVKPPNPEELARLVADVARQGDPARGEDVFRRADLNCTSCHAVTGAGGGVGPDLSAVGASSPVDYLIHSVMTPDQAIKEAYQTLLVQTADGQVFQGIVVDRDDRRVVLKEATGDLRTVPTSEIEDSKEGGSLMPKGLVNFMTRAEFVDLIRFLSELGRPGPYAIRATPTIQRWRVAESPDASEDRWRPAYARVSGALPLDGLASATGSKALALKGEVEVAVPGAVTFRLDSADGVRAWVDGEPAPEGATIPATLARGRHTLTLRVDLAARRGKELMVEVVKPPGSSAEFTVVGGR